MSTSVHRMRSDGKQKGSGFSRDVKHAIATYSPNSWVTYQGRWWARRGGVNSRLASGFEPGTDGCAPPLTAPRRVSCRHSCHDKPLLDARRLGPFHEWVFLLLVCALEVEPAKVGPAGDDPLAQLNLLGPVSHRFVHRLAAHQRHTGGSEVIGSAWGKLPALVATCVTSGRTCNLLHATHLPS